MGVVTALTPPAAHEPLLRDAGWGAKRAPARPASLPPRPEPTRLPGLDPVTGEPLF